MEDVMPEETAEANETGETNETETAGSRFSPGQRAMALVLVTLFALVVMTSTIFSLGSYCLTTHGGDTRALVETLRTFFL